MTVTADRSPTLAERAHYGFRVVSRALGVIGARASAAPPAISGVPFNAMFDSARLEDFAAERRALSAFDLHLFAVMNSARLEGQIVFEYGTLLRAVDRWKGRRVLDVGTGASTLPKWMSAQGSEVTTFDLAAPAELRAGGFHGRLDGLIARRPGIVRPVAGSMTALPFADASFDLVTSLSVVEHLDTEFPSRRYVEYAEQKRRLALTLDEMARVLAPGGLLFLTSDCCDFSRASTDNWRQSYYCTDGPALSGAWPAADVPRLFYSHVTARGCSLVGDCGFDPDAIGDPGRWTYRGPFFSGFSVLARRGA